MHKLTWKEMILLSALCLGGCCDVFETHDIRVPYEHKHDAVHNYDLNYPARHNIVRPYVVNNTPHIKRQDLSKDYNEKVKEIGLVGSHGEVL